MHRVAILAYDTVVALELATAVQVFSAANLHVDHPAYEVGVASDLTSVTTSALWLPSFALIPDHPLAWAQGADTVIIPAHASFLEPPPPHIGAILGQAHRRGARVASLCVGAFILASTGLLNGRSATTHWNWAHDLSVMFPSVTVEPDLLFVGQDGIYSAAGVTATLDLILHLIEGDLGAGVAATTARFLVAPMRREGGQAQFVEYAPPRRTSALQGTLRWAEDHLIEDLTVADLAQHARMTARTFSRQFRANVGTTPLDWLLRTRIRRAQQILESTDWKIDRIASATGFRSASTFRHHFMRLTDVTPNQYRRSFGKQK